MQRVTVSSVLFSGLVFAGVLGVNFDAQVHERHVALLGEAPLGMPVMLLVGIVETLLCLPIPWIVWHAFRLSWQANEDRRKFGLGYLYAVGGLHPHLRRSQMVCFAGLVYCLILTGGGVAFAALGGGV